MSEVPDDITGSVSTTLACLRYRFAAAPHATATLWSYQIRLYHQRRFSAFSRTKVKVVLARSMPAPVEVVLGAGSLGCRWVITPRLISAARCVHSSGFEPIDGPCVSARRCHRTRRIAIFQTIPRPGFGLDEDATTSRALLKHLDETPRRDLDAPRLSCVCATK